ncbi:MAG: helix-turn-helix domain-containing protein [Candidatus Binataceae bacterium]
MKLTQRKTQRRNEAPPRHAPRNAIMTLKEVAEYLRVNPVTVYKLIRQGGIPVFKIGSDYRFERDEIEKWIAGKERLPDRSN